MAQAAVLTVNNFPNGVDNTMHQQTVYGLVTFTGSGGYTTGGVPLNWATMVNVDGSPFIPSVGPQATLKPSLVYFTPQDTSLVEYQYNLAGNTLFATLATAAGATQLPAATTLSGVIAFEAHFGRGV
jgi:hypothetical protein